MSSLFLFVEFPTHEYTLFANFWTNKNSSIFFEASQQDLNPKYDNKIWRHPTYRTDASNINDEKYWAFWIILAPSNFRRHRRRFFDGDVVGKCDSYIIGFLKLVCRFFDRYVVGFPTLVCRFFDECVIGFPTLVHRFFDGYVIGFLTLVHRFFDGLAIVNLTALP